MHHHSETLSPPSSTYRIALTPADKSRSRREEPPRPESAIHSLAHSLCACLCACAPVRPAGRPCHLTIIQARPPCERLQQWTLDSSTAACFPAFLFSLLVFVFRASGSVASRVTSRRIGCVVASLRRWRENVLLGVFLLHHAQSHTPCRLSVEERLVGVTSVTIAAAAIRAEKRWRGGG